MAAATSSFFTLVQSYGYVAVIQILKMWQELELNIHSTNLDSFVFFIENMLHESNSLNRYKYKWMLLVFSYLPHWNPVRSSWSESWPLCLQPSSGPQKPMTSLATHTHTQQQPLIIPSLHMDRDFTGNIHTHVTIRIYSYVVRPLLLKQTLSRVSTVCNFVYIYISNHEIGCNSRFHTYQGTALFSLLIVILK